MSEQLGINWCRKTPTKSKKLARCVENQRENPKHPKPPARKGIADSPEPQDLQGFGFFGFFGFYRCFVNVLCKPTKQKTSIESKKTKAQNRKFFWILSMFCCLGQYGRQNMYENFNSSVDANFKFWLFRAREHPYFLI